MLDLLTCHLLFVSANLVEEGFVEKPAPPHSGLNPIDSCVGGFLELTTFTS